MRFFLRLIIKLHTTMNPLEHAKEKARNQCPLTYEEMRKLVAYLLLERDDDEGWREALRLHLISDDPVWMSSEPLYSLWTNNNSLSPVRYEDLFLVVQDLLKRIKGAGLMALR